jgi:hypothetical protein
MTGDYGVPSSGKSVLAHPNNFWIWALKPGICHVSSRSNGASEEQQLALIGLTT